ncbi:MAG: regulatory iron-sulfur-containing complex subunit RicT [bacterium]
MFKIVEVQFHIWDKAYDFSVGDQEIKIGDEVLVRTEIGMEEGKVIGMREDSEYKYDLIISDEWENDSFESQTNGVEDQKNGNSKQRLMSIIRKINSEDSEKIAENQKQKPIAMDYCVNVIKRMGLGMKLIDAHISFDGRRMTFAFLADGRVDFRELVKEMTRHFQKSIRMQQLGARDEVKINGSFAHCGQELCCKKFLKTLGGVNSDLASNQQIAHRGSERLSGACGRLMCCLRYENDDYVELIKNMPQIGSILKTPLGTGKVINWHTLKQTVDVKIGDDENRGTVVEVAVGKNSN